MERIKKQEKNPWKTASYILGMLCLLLIALSYYEEKQVEDEKLRLAIEFLEFAQQNQLGEVCNTQSGICCNTRTGTCDRVIEDAQFTTNENGGEEDE